MQPPGTGPILLPTRLCPGQGCSLCAALASVYGPRSMEARRATEVDQRAGRALPGSPLASEGRRALPCSLYSLIFHPVHTDRIPLRWEPSPERCQGFTQHRPSSVHPSAHARVLRLAALRDVAHGIRGQGPCSAPSDFTRAQSGTKRPSLTRDTLHDILCGESNTVSKEVTAPSPAFGICWLPPVQLTGVPSCPHCCWHPWTPALPLLCPFRGYAHTAVR